jgi:hypothetical protein
VETKENAIRILLEEIVAELIMRIFLDGYIEDVKEKL